MGHRKHSALTGALGTRGGKTQIEVLAVFVLLLLLGVSAFTLAMAGADSFRALSGFRDQSAATRVALSYTTMKIHQYDAQGVLSLEPHPVTGETALVIRETVAGQAYETWVYYSGGYLREALVTAGQTPTDEYGFEVIPLTGYTLSPAADGSGVRVEAASRDERDRTFALSAFVAFRSGEVRP